MEPIVIYFYEWWYIKRNVTDYIMTRSLQIIHTAFVDLKLLYIYIYMYNQSVK